LQGAGAFEGKKGNLMPKRKNRADKFRSTEKEVKAFVSLAVTPKPSQVGQAMAEFYAKAYAPVPTKKVEMLSSIAELLSGEKNASPRMVVDLLGLDLGA
jgi:hypothetical protein